MKDLHKPEKFAYLKGYRCMYCGVVWSGTDPHPVHAMFVNGYPAPCEKIGMVPGEELSEDKNTLPWVIGVTKEYDNKLLLEEERLHYRHYFGWRDFPSEEEKK